MSRRNRALLAFPAASLAIALALPACATQSGQAEAQAQPAEQAQPAAQAQSATAARPAPRTIEQTIESTATVTAIDAAKREITLRNEEGEMQTIAVGQEMTRFNEIAVGDRVRARYTIGITSELRPPTEEEKKEPFLALEGGGRSPDGTAPAAGAARMFRVVATVDAIDKADRTATLKGPQGNYVTVAVQDPALLDTAKVGDTVVVTAAESVALSLEKVDGK